MIEYTLDWKANAAARDALWREKMGKSQALPKKLCVGKVFTLVVCDGKVLYEVAGTFDGTRGGVLTSECFVKLVDGGPDNYMDAVLGEGGWFPSSAIEPLVLRTHGLNELFGGAVTG